MQYLRRSKFSLNCRINAMRSTRTHTDAYGRSCTDDDKPKDKTKRPHTHHTHTPHASGFHTKYKTHSNSKHPAHPTTCIPPHHLPIASSNDHRSDIATNSPACAIPGLNRLLRRCNIPIDLPSLVPEPYPSTGLCVAPYPIVGTGYPVPTPTSTSTRISTSTSTSSVPEIKTMDYTSQVDGYGASPTVVKSVTKSVSGSVQLPVETFDPVPQEEVPDDGEGERKKEPACGKGMSTKTYPPVDENM
ncbi:hypothetical protein ONS95_002510 [Cadophora gregata]|uniref:uncharacterized protein n=1 Tax=Cadophora gregata TaxID=51156 RepID=UPI0026DD913C|nr:uncharacterized protein ONS95_002510 [Cadophora gregata]KAK0109839.1 hypothetical protein ONS95_002510 [Cadophora gregata]